MQQEGRSETEASRLVQALVTDYRKAELGPADLALLDYSVKLTLRPSSIIASDITQLRAAGFGDRAVHDICAIAAYFAFVNRIADGLGVDLEPRFRE